MLQIKLYNRPVENAIFIPDFMMKDEILKCIKSSTTLITHQQIVLYVVRALIANKTINNNDVECYVDDVKYNILPNGRFESYPSDIFEECIDAILGVF